MLLLLLLPGILYLLNAQQFPPLLVPIIEKEGTIPGERLDFVAGLGDINHDGFDDIAATRSNLGKTFIYYGGNPPDLIPDIVLEGLSQTQAGDINHNNEIDLVIRQNETPYRFAVYYDVFTTDTIPDQIIYLPSGATSIFLGPLGDLNADGYLDIPVANFNFNFPAGAVWIYGGTPSGIDTLPTYSIIGDNSQNKNLGLSHATGDVNGDGEPDLVVHGRGGSQGDKGYINIYYGGVAFDTIPDFRLGGTANLNFNFDSRQLCVMDVNGDTQDDILIIGHGYDSAYVFYGGNILDTIPDFIFTAPPYGYLGYPANAGDTNNDCSDDVVFGSPGSLGSGLIILYHGGGQLDDVPNGAIAGYAWTDFGLTVAGAGRFDGDDRDDIVAGGPGDGTVNRRGMFGVYKDTTTIVVGIPEPHIQTIIPELFELHQSYPNPFNNHAIIPYELFQSAQVELSIYNSLGQEIRTLISGMVPAGGHTAQWDGRDDQGNSVASGVYVYRMKVNGHIKSRQMRFIK